jgi:aspartyl aminopeptidase
MVKKKEEKGKYDKLFLEKKSAWELLEKQTKKAFVLGEEYKDFLNNNKTEREIVTFVEKTVKKKGYVSIDKATKASKKIYAINHNKAIALINLGKGNLSKGINIVGSHIDSLRLDLKLNPFYETDPFTMINLHYYGGIKKYHWLNVPLAMHGIIINKKGEKKQIVIGENEKEPVFVISDLLPHLDGREQLAKKASDIITGEAMDAIGASIPVNDEKTKEKVKANLLSILNKKYDITEEDFVSADLSLFPANKARDVGIDAGMIGAPAHDDRSCSFLGVKAFLENNSSKACAMLLVDKEEIGSVGNTAMSSMFFENLIEKIAKLTGEKVSAHAVLENSKALSADVTSGFDPKYADMMDPHNMNKVGYGISIEKGTGFGGKYSGSEAHAEFMAEIRTMLDKAKIPWQYGEMGKVDQGGGGTIAYLLAKYNMNIIDAGPPVLAMHSPFELVSKIDLLSTLLAYKVFFESK